MCSGNSLRLGIFKESLYWTLLPLISLATTVTSRDLKTIVSSLSTNRSLGKNKRTQIEICGVGWGVQDHPPTLVDRFPFVRSDGPRRTGSSQFILKGQSWRARTFFPQQLSLADRSRRTEWLWSISRVILAKTSSENSWVPFENWQVGQTENDLGLTFYAAPHSLH